MKDDCCEGGMPPGLASRVAVSIIVFFGWLVFLIIWLVFYAGSYSLLENIAVIVVAFLVGIAILAAMWASWGMKFSRKMEHWKNMEHPGQERKRPRRRRK